MTTPVTIVLPTLDEREHITDCLDSLLAQDYPAIAEILAFIGDGVKRPLCMPQNRYDRNRASADTDG